MLFAELNSVSIHICDRMRKKEPIRTRERQKIIENSNNSDIVKSIENIYKFLYIKCFVAGFFIHLMESIRWFRRLYRNNSLTIWYNAIWSHAFVAAIVKIKGLDSKPSEFIGFSLKSETISSQQRDKQLKWQRVRQSTNKPKREIFQISTHKK